jgi:F-type H+-transporting ATPase subunit delta
MNDLSIARRYARALSEEAALKGDAAMLDDDIELIESTLEGSRELVRVFESPVIPREKKKAVFHSLLQDRVQPLTLRLLDLLVEKNRESVFPMVVRAYRQLRDEEAGVVEARARVAVELPESEKQAMKARLEAITGKKVRMRMEVDSELIGGAVVRIGDTVYDGSVSNKLSALRSRMHQGSFIQN